MSRRIKLAEFQALAELRYRIRCFLKEGDAAARGAGLEPQQYLMLLAIRGLDPQLPPKIQTFAERLALKHHSAVELVDRLEQRGLVRRTRSKEDRRQVMVSLLPRGEKLLETVVQQRISELRASGRGLVQAVDALLRDAPQEPGTPGGSKRRLLRKAKRIRENDFDTPRNRP